MSATRPRKNRIVVNLDTLGGKTVDAPSRADGAVLVFNEGEDQYEHRDPATLPVSFASVTNKPDTLEGFGINNAYNKTAIGDPFTEYVLYFEAALV